MEDYGRVVVVEFTLPELNPTAKVRHKMYVVPKMSKYDLIIGPLEQKLRKYETTRL